MATGENSPSYELESIQSSPKYSRQSSRAVKAKKSFKESVNKFFLGDEFDQDKWQTRSRRLQSRSIGVKFKQDEPISQSEDTLDSVFETTSRSGSRRAPHPIVDPLARSRYHRADSHASSHYGRQYSRQLSRLSHISTASSSRRSARNVPTPRSRKDSVFHMALDGFKTAMGSGTDKKSLRKPYMHSRSFAPQSMSSYMDEMEELRSPGAESVFPEDPVDDDFFTAAVPTSFMSTPVKTEFPLPPIEEFDKKPVARPSAVKVDVEEDGADDPSKRFFQRPMPVGWQHGRQRPPPLPGTPEDVLDAPFDDLERAGNVMKEALHDIDNSDRREIGKGFVGRMFGREYRSDRIDEKTQQLIEEMTEHRPYFTYWITFVQIFIYIFSVAVYGIAPIGFDQTVISAEVLKPNLAIENVQYMEKDNLWIGPRQADLIHLGAKYSPCMRKDANVEAAILNDRWLENKTACCVRNDGSGCVQTSNVSCSKTLSTWNKWTANEPGFEGRTSGSVCGQSPKYCTNPASSAPFVWEDTIISWPICTETSSAPDTAENKHMTCDLTGRPCCVGIQGECIITSREYCEFRKGYFHGEATLCSQISCMSEICGMIRFLDPERPDQFYRLWTSLFLHAGLIQLIVTIAFQFFIMRDVEKLTGWFRVCIIYIGSGISGALSSAIFLPYHVEAGPAGSQFGLLACLVVEGLQNWHIIKNPGWALGKQMIFLVVLFAFGLLPYIDNYAHLIGFIFGFFLSFALLPHIKFNKCDKRGKIIGIILCLISACGGFALLIVLFYVTPVYNCPYCHYFTCIPFTPNFCKSMEVKIGREEIY